jgi:hypothetical protein
MLGLTKDSARNVLIIFISILMFQSIPRFQMVGKYFEQYPILIFGIAILLLIYSDKIVSFIGK